jgi:hypothetical protein
MFNFVFDLEHLGRPYPNLAPMMDASNGYHGMGDEYPYIIPCRLLYFCQDHEFPMTITYIDQPMPDNAFYPVGIGFFDFGIDYFAMMSAQVLDLCRTNKLKILFYYHEGDNPYLERDRLDALCYEHELPNSCYCFVSGNTEANKIDRFVYFADHELFYWRSAVVWNKQEMPGCEPHLNPRSRQFTALSRLHKWWRATAMSYMHRQRLLENSYWSYNTLDHNDVYEENPIELSRFQGLPSYLDRFMAGAPYTADTQSEEEHNSHWTLVREHFDDSYCNLVLETLYSAEDSHGAFLSEKTFKPIRHGQPFMIFGTANSLATLRQLGYRTFDHAINNRYDYEPNNTTRFIKTVEEVERISSLDMHGWYEACWDDLVHNQQLFLSSKFNRLNSLYLSLTL